MNPFEIAFLDPRPAPKSCAVLFAAHRAVAITGANKRAVDFEFYATAEAAAVKRGHYRASLLIRLPGFTVIMRQGSPHGAALGKKKASPASSAGRQMLDLLH